MFKLALSAGHYYYTLGKRCDYRIDKNETREWVLNDRICDKIENKLKAYDGIEILRLDDTTGKKGISLKARSDASNKWGADLYLAIHHNAAKSLFSGGGVSAHIYKKPTDEEIEWQKLFYDAVIEETGLKGNRATPLVRGNLHENREPKAASVLLECGFMNSTVDVPIILTEDFAEGVAKACVEVIVKKAKLKPRKDENKVTKQETTIGYITYTVKKGDSLWKIAKSLLGNGSKYTEIAAINEIKDNFIYAGQVLKIPSKKANNGKVKVGDKVTLKAGAKTYTGGNLASYVYKRKHIVKELKNDRAVITYNGTVVAAVNVKDLTLA
jgi:N-acetylmuramoyl-L-alanine amidase